MPSLSLSMWRISVCAEAESSLTRSSKVNISDLMRSADSRLSSSSEVIKRVSVWRSKLLKISAITSWASRRRGLRDVGHEFGAQRLLDALEHLLLHRLHLEHAVDDVERELFRQDGEHARGMLGAQLGEHDGNGLRVLVLQVVGEHLFLHVRELLPHVAAGRPADLVHDAADALRRQVLLQQSLGMVVVAHQRAGSRQLADEFEQQVLDKVPADGAERRHHDRERPQVVVVEQAPDFRPVLIAQREHQHRRALRAGELARGALLMLAARQRGDEILDLGGRGSTCGSGHCGSAFLRPHFRAARCE